MVSSSTLGRLSTQTMAFSGTAARFGRNFHRQFSPHFIVTTGPWRFARCLCEQTPLCSQFKAALLFAVPADWRGCSSRFNVAVESCVVSRGLVMRGAPLDFSASSPHQTNSARQASSRTSPHGGRTFVLSGLKLSVWIISGLFKGYCPGVALVLGTMCHWQVLREGTHFYLLRLRYFVSSSGFVFFAALWRLPQPCCVTAGSVSSGTGLGSVPGLLTLESRADSWSQLDELCTIRSKKITDLTGAVFMFFEIVKSAIIVIGCGFIFELV